MLKAEIIKAFLATVADDANVWIEDGELVVTFMKLDHAHVTKSLTVAGEHEDGFEAHRAADPHCTCNDCIEHFAENADDDATETDEPDDDAITTTDHEKFYQYRKLVVWRTGKLWWFRRDGGPAAGELLSDFGDDSAAALRMFMARVQFWPDVWFVSDHGNTRRIAIAAPDETAHYAAQADADRTNPNTAAFTLTRADAERLATGDPAVLNAAADARASRRDAALKAARDRRAREAK